MARIVAPSKRWKILTLLSAFASAIIFFLFLIISNNSHYYSVLSPSPVAHPKMGKVTKIGDTVSRATFIRKNLSPTIKHEREEVSTDKKVSITLTC